MNEIRKPFKAWRSGSVEVAVWDNDGKMSVSITKSWREQDSGEWTKRSLSVAQGDLLEVAKFLTDAFEASVERRQEQVAQSAHSDTATEELEL